VTEYLSSSLIDDYAAGDLDDLKRESDFMAQEEQRSVGRLEDSTRELTVFLAAHPEFALEARQAATPFGPNPAAGIPFMPTPTVLPREPGGAADPQLESLLRQRARVGAEIRGAAAPSGSGSTFPAAKSLDDQIAQAEAQLEAAAKRANETQADLASKSNLTEDHPDMRAARMAVEAAAQRLHETRVELAALRQQKASGSLVDPAHAPPEVAERLRQIDAQIAAHRAQSTSRSPSSELAQHASEAKRQAGEGAGGVVELETEWQRLLRGLNDSKARHDDLKLHAERTKLALLAARAQANEEMAIVEPPYRPTHPSKGGRTNIAIAGVAAACLLAIAYAGARAMLDDTLVYAEDVEALSLVPVLGVLPELRPAGPPPRKEALDDGAA
jgi:hypothetical protein